MTKKTFIFQTGHAKGLAKAEIEAILGKVVIDEVHDGWVIESTELPPKLLLKMGGIVRITEVIQSGPASMPLNFEEWISKAVANEVKITEGKVRFGLSMHPKSEQVLKKILNTSKRRLKTELGNVRFVNKDFQNLSSVQAWHEKLLADNAVELHLFKSERKWYMAKTIAIQNFEWYSQRDYDRPARDARNGMFPPKLAQILINLSQPEADATIYDPFCGSGTVVQEAWLMNLRAQGSDLEEAMVKDTETNMEWLKRETELDREMPTLFQADATKLQADQVPDYPFCIVTETWLGPALNKPPSPLELPKIQREIENLYHDFFTNLKKIIKKPVTMVFTAPYHREGHKRHFLPQLPQILAESCQIVSLSEHARPTLFFERKHQIVSREIWKIVCEP